MSGLDPTDPSFLSGKELPLVGMLLATVFAIRAMKDRNRDHREKTVSAVNRAATETLKYEHWRDAKDGARDREREIGLAGFWKDASYYVRHYSEELADRLVQKGEYWMNPDVMTSEDIARARIGLETVVAEANSI